MILNRLSLTCCITGGLFLSTTLLASDEETLVVGSALKLSSDASSSQVSIIDSDTIKAINGESVFDVLRQVVGVHVSQQGGPGGVSELRIRGSESNFVVIMIDGVKVNLPTNSRGGSYDLSKIPLESIERIEIIRGAQSGRFGSDSLAGVVNIVTKVSVRQDKLKASISSDEQFEMGVLHGRSVTDNFSYSVSLNYSESDERVPGDTHDAFTANVKSRYKINARHRIDFNSYYQDRARTAFPEDSGGPEYAVLREVDRSDVEDWTVGLNSSSEWTPVLSSTVYINRFQHDSFTASPGISPFFEVPKNSNTDAYQRDDIGVSVEWALAETERYKSRAVVGLEYENEEGESEGALDLGQLIPTSFNLDRSAQSVNINLYGDIKDLLSFELSSRYNDFSEAGDHSASQIGVAIPLSFARSTLSANWGEGFKLPSFFALGHSLVGNPDLKPEESTSYDVSVATDWVPAKLNSTLTFFKSDYENLIDFSPELFRNVNRSSVETEGVELEFHYSPVESISSSLAVTYLDIDAEQGVVLRGRPSLSASAFLSWQASDTLLLSSNYRHQGSVTEASRHTGSTVFEELSAYDIVSMSAQWEPGNWGVLSLALDNVLDTGYEEAIGFPGLGFAARLGVTLNLGANKDE